MVTILKCAGLYLFLLVVFRLAGRRTLASLTTFDFVVLLIVSEATQNVLAGEDRSMTGACLAVLTLLGLDVSLSLAKMRAPGLERWLDGLPTVIVRDGRPLERALMKSRVDLVDVLAAARETHGLSRLDEIEYAVLETNGRISIVPRRGERG